MDQTSQPEEFLLTSLSTTAQQVMAQDDTKSVLSSLDSNVLDTPPLAGTPAPAISGPAYSAPLPGSQTLATPYGLSSSTAEILARMTSQPPSDYTNARDHVLKSITTSDNLPALPIPSSGRGRGRPKGSGKRGGMSATTVAGASSSAINTPPGPSFSTPKASSALRGGKTRGSGRGRGGKKSGKRKRAISDELSLSDSEDGVKNEGNDDEDGSDGAIVVPRITKSGRAVHRPSQFVPVLPSPTTGSAKKKRIIKKNPDNAVCKPCGRGHSPNNNAIVFCDGCSTPYHQYCHTPPIEKEFIENLDQEWLCAECAGVMVPPPFDLKNLVSGQALSNDEKRASLSRLTHSQLVDILLQATSTQPSLAVFPSSSHTIGGAPDEPPAELLYDGYETDPPAHYPKAGNGLARTLPPESEDLDWLLDDNTEVFSQVNNYANVLADARNGKQPLTLSTNP